MIRVVTLTDPLGEGKEIRLEPWAPGASARSLAPEPEGWGCRRNGLLLLPEEWDEQLADQDTLVFALRPGFVAAGSAFAVISLEAGTIGSIATFAAPFVNAAILSFAIRFLLGPGKRPSVRGDQESATYGFANLSSNARLVGTPIPVVYGSHRVAPPIINQYVRNYLDATGTPISDLLVLLLVSEGPILAIGGKTADGGAFTSEAGDLPSGIQIENQPAENFVGVEAHVRLGGINQTSIPGFAQPVNQYGVNQVLRQSATNVPPEGAEATAGVFPSGDANITKWDTAISYTMGEVADGFTAVISFPAGLFITSSSGNANANDARFQIRYRRVDGGGTAFGDYVVLAPEPTISLARRSAFALEFSHDFFSTTGFVPQGLGHFLQMPVAHTDVTYDADETKLPAPSTDVLEFSCVGWWRNKETFSAGTSRYIWSWTDASTVTKGFALYFALLVTSGTVVLTTPTIRFGTGATQKEVAFDGSLASAFGVSFFRDLTNPHLWGFTYRANVDSAGNSRFRLFYDGVLVQEKLTLDRAAHAFEQLIRLGARFDGTLDFVGDEDDTEFFSRELTPFEIVSKWNAGKGAPGAAVQQGLLVGLRFDTEIVSGGRRYSPEVYGPGTNAATPGVDLGVSPAGGTSPTISTGTNYGIVPTPESGTLIRERFLIEIQRINGEDGVTNPAQSDQSDWSIIQLRTYDDSTFPGLALLALKIRATDQVSAAQPLLTCLADGRFVPVWDRSDAANPTLIPTFSRSPAWIATDVALNRLYGLGEFYTAATLDLPSFAAFADWCDELVYDGGERLTVLSIFTGVGDPTIPTDYIEFLVASPLPSNWPSTTAGFADTGVWAAVLDGGGSPAPPAWLAKHIGVAYPIRRVGEVPGSSISFIRCELPVSDGVNAAYQPSSGITAEAREPRMLYDGVFDRAEVPAWEAILDILRTARAAPVRRGARISVFFDDVRPTMGLTGMAAIVAGSFRQEFSEQKDRPNAVQIEYSDANQNYERVTAELEHPDLTDPTRQSSFRWRRYALEGVTRRSQVLRHAKRDLNVAKLIRRLFEFEMALDAVYFGPGDVIALSHDVPGFGVSGRLWADAIVENLLSKAETFSAWLLGTHAVLAVSTGTATPLGIGTTWKLASAGGASGEATWHLGAGAWPAAGTILFFGAYLKQGTAPDLALQVFDVDTATQRRATFAWSGSNLTVVSSSTGVTAAVSNAGLAAGWWRAGWWYTVTSGEEGHDLEAYVHLPITAPFASKDVEVFGAQLRTGGSTGTFPAYRASQTIQLDRPVIIAAATAYQVQIEGQTSNSRATVAVEVGISVPGTYATGAVLVLRETGFGFSPAAQDKYAFGRTDLGETKLVAILETVLDPQKITRRIKAVEYQPAVYDDDFGTLPPSQSDIPLPGSSVPSPVVGLSIQEDTALGPDGGLRVGAVVSWTHPAETFGSVLGSRVWVSAGHGSNVGAELLAEVPAGVTSVRVAHPFERDVDYVLSVQVVGRSGMAVSRDLATRATFRPSALGPSPGAIQGLSALSVGEDVLYTWDDPGATAEGASVEIRRGGWILGELIGRAPARAMMLGPTPDLVTGPLGALGVRAPIYARLRAGNGQYGPAARLDVDLTIPGADSAALDVQHEDSGWTATKTALAVGSYPASTAEEATGLKPLVPSGGGLTHSYDFQTGVLPTAAWGYFHVAYEAFQIHPTTVAELDLLGPVGGRELSQWTAEGPLYMRAGYLANGSAHVDVVASANASPGSGFSAFRAGNYRIRSAKCKLTVVRPSTAHSFRIRRMAARFVRSGEDQFLTRGQWMGAQ